MSERVRPETRAAGVRTLDLPVTANDGSPLTYGWWADERPDGTTERGHIRPALSITGLRLMLLFGLLAWGLLGSPGA